MKNPATGVQRLINATGYSIAGLRASYKTEAAFRQEVWLALVLVPLAFLVGDNSLEVAILLSSVLLLLIVELLNTAVEFVVDRIGAEYHELSGRAKDAGSAAVFLTMMLLVILWVGVAVH